jgi:hypothetical protein
MFIVLIFRYITQNIRTALFLIIIKIQKKFHTKHVNTCMSIIHLQLKRPAYYYYKSNYSFRAASILLHDILGEAAATLLSGNCFNFRTVSLLVYNAL